MSELSKNAREALELLMKVARLIPGLKGYEVHAWSLSATILYDPNVLPFELWDDFCSICKNPDAESSFRRRVLSLFENNGDPAAGSGSK